jgi:uroporphyrin-3 C-methyltransferase
MTDNSSDKEPQKPEADTKAAEREPGKGKPTPGSGKKADGSGGGTPPPSPAKTTAGGTGSGRALGVVALIVALLVAAGGAGGGYWVWRQLQGLQADQSQFASASALQSQTESLKQRLGEVSARLSNLNEQMGGRGQALADVKAATDNLKDEQRAIEQRMQRISELAKASRDDWRRSEAAYLATVAEHRLRFYSDVDAALGALKEADRLLAGFGGESIDARKGIARAIDRLVDVNPARQGAIARRLGDLEDRVEALPAGPVPKLKATAEQDGTDAQETADGGWRARLQQAWTNFKRGLGQLVVVVREPEVVPITTPDQRAFLLLNLRFELATARLAALQGRQALYDRSLERIRNWMGRYFDPDSREVRDVQAELADLAAEHVSVKLPDIAPLLKPVRQFE